jgi:hypothetical protein
MKILWICLRFPYPVKDGASLASMALLTQIVKEGRNRHGENFQLDLVCLYDQAPELAAIEEMKKLTGCKSLLLMKKNSMRFLGAKILPRLLFRVRNWSTPLTLAPFSHKRTLKQLHEWIGKRKWDFTVIDGLHVHQLVRAFGDSKPFAHVIYRAHNVESHLWDQVFEKTSNPLMRFVLSRERRLFRKYEADVCRRSAAVVPVSKIDSEHFRSEFHAHNVKPVEIGLNCASEPLKFENSDALELLFVGRLDWLPNREGLHWFLSSVWPRINSAQNRKFRLTIVGSGDSSWLEPLIHGSEIRFVKNAADLKPYYQRSHLTLIPLFMGSGTRVKAIESGGMARSFISTRVGVEGLPFSPNQEFFQSETAEEWIRFLLEVDLKNLELMGERLWQTTLRNFERGHLARKFNSVLEELVFVREPQTFSQALQDCHQ